MDQSGRPVGHIAALEALKLPHAHVQGDAVLPIGDLPGQRGAQQPGPRDFLAAHRQCLLSLHGVTLSLTSYGMTFLWTNGIDFARD
jgi:hypothetical protein